MTTATATMAVANPGTLMDAPTSAHCCPKCGFGADLPPFEETQTALRSAQKQISDLEAQVRLLNQKASAAVDRWADYEDELAKLRSQLNSRPQTPTPTPLQSAARQQPNSLPTPPSSAAGLPTPSPSRGSFLTTSAASRISALLSRKSPPPPPPPPPPGTLRPLPTAALPTSPIPSVPSSATYPAQNPRGSGGGGGPLSPPPSLPTSSHLTPEDLLAALAREQALRAEAESQLCETSREVEELSVSLFEQANEMVATERRARAKLEERVGELEKREGDKRRRLDRLERAVGRIERVRGLLREEAEADMKTA